MNTQNVGHGIELLDDGRVIVDPKKFDVIPQQPFDRVYLDRYNALNCKSDIETVCGRLTAKQVTNVMAAWTAYRRQYGIYKEHVNDTTQIVYAPNKRMATFLRHMTKWQIVQNKLPTCEFMYFGINPDRKELQDVTGLEVSRHIIIGSHESFISRYFGVWSSLHFQDRRILGPNKTVSF